MEGRSKQEATPDVSRAKGVKDPIINSMKESFEILLKGLSEHIERGDYGALIGDDASGRIPTLVFDKLIKARYKELKHQVPQTLFVAGSRELEPEARLEKQKKYPNLLKRPVSTRDIPAACL